YISVYYPNYKGLSKNAKFFHTRYSRAVSWIGLHDMFHSLIASRYSKRQIDFDFDCVDTLRKLTKNKWSMGIWNLADHPEDPHAFLGDYRNTLDRFFDFLNSCLCDFRKKDFFPEMAALLF